MGELERYQFPYRVLDYKTGEIVVHLSESVRLLFKDSASYLEWVREQEETTA